MIRGLRTPRSPAVLIAAILLVALAAPLALTGPVAAASPADDATIGARSIVGDPSTTLVGTTSIVPGSVGRTSLHLRTTYAATLRLDYRTRAFAVHSAATITNTSGAAIDRVELNTAVAR